LRKKETIYNLFEQPKARFLKVVLGDLSDLIRTIRIQIKKNIWDLETYRKSYKKLLLRLMHIVYTILCILDQLCLYNFGKKLCVEQIDVSFLAHAKTKYFAKKNSSQEKVLFVCKVEFC
jgi:hypothetical protein